MEYWVIWKLKNLMIEKFVHPAGDLKD